jgi:hypothetical protein
MKVSKWTVGLAGAGLVTLPALVQAEEKPSAIMTALSSTTISGYVDTSAQWDIGTGNAFVPGFVYNAGKQDGFNLNKVKVRIERPLDEAQWAAGYKVDLLFGPDANTFGTSSLGTIAATSDFAIQQAYVALRAPVGNGLDLKLGVFDSIIGYESHDSVNNPNYTRSYGTTIEPHTHTGLLATYQAADWIGIAAGIANTFGPTINQRANPPKAESYKTYMASVALTAPESMSFLKGSTIYAGVINGFNSGTQPSTATPGLTVGGQQTSWYVGATVATPITALKVGASYDYARAGSVLDTTAGPPGTPLGSTHQEAAAIYASLQATEKLSLHARGEYFWQSGTLASRLAAGQAANLAAGIISTPIPVLPSKVFAATGTVQYDLWKNVLSRLEVRWDHAANGSDAYGGDPGAVTPAPGKKNAVLVAANIVYKF